MTATRNYVAELAPKVSPRRLLNPVQVPVSSPKTNNTVVGGIVLIAVLGFAVVLHNLNQRAKATSLIQQQQAQQYVSPSTSPASSLITDQYQRLSYDMLALSDQIDAIKKRQSVLGIVSNENAAILKNGQSPGYLVYINQDWSLSRTPTMVKLDEKTKNMLDSWNSSN